MDFTEETATGAVVASFEGAADPRLREVLGSLVRHLHGFVREVEPTFEEWERAIGFLTATGQKCDDTRQEFILLSDVLGVTMLVDAINHRTATEATDSTVLGPFHMVASPRRELGDTIDLVATGEPCVVTGRVLSLDGSPLPGALVDVWQADDHGFYDVQQPGTQPQGNGRGLFACDEDGRFWFRTVTPSPYPIPTDGPVGRLLTATGRHPYRPAHIHFIVAADGHLPVTTHIFVAGSPYLDSDAVFAVKQRLITDFARVDDPDQAAAFGF
jgi:hydroxyquinol 1,2-dioxygenase